MIYINITNFALIRYLEKDHSMMETRRLKNILFSIFLLWKSNVDFFFLVKEYKHWTQNTNTANVVLLSLSQIADIFSC